MFPRGQINSARKISLKQRFDRVLRVKQVTDPGLWVPEIFLQSYAYLFISLFLKCYCQPLDERQINYFLRKGQVINSLSLTGSMASISTI